MDIVIIDGLSFALPLFIMAIGGIYCEKSGVTMLAVEGLQVLAPLSVHSWRLPLRETLPETLRRLSTLPWLWRLWAEVCLH